MERFKTKLNTIGDWEQRLSIPPTWRREVQGGHKNGHTGEKAVAEGEANGSRKPESGNEPNDLGGTPGPIRTADLLLRRQTLYPAELRAHNLLTSQL